VGVLWATGGLLAAGGASAADDPARSLLAGAVPTSDVHRWVMPQTLPGNDDLPDLDDLQGGDYWTPQRMRAATPGSTLVDDNIMAESSTPDSEAPKSGPVTQVPAQAADAQVETEASDEALIDHIGKVFFTLRGADYVCSGNAISSANENTVATAGHCLNAGPGAFVSRLTFVPAYDNGAAPYGQWDAIELFAPTQWTMRGDISYDTGFVIVSSPTGSTLSDTVGASGVVFNDSRELSYTAYGYPALPPFTGETLQSCAGSATADPYGQTESQGIPCDMTGGSSGGPWFVSDDTHERRDDDSGERRDDDSGERRDDDSDQRRDESGDRRDDDSGERRRDDSGERRDDDSDQLQNSVTSFGYSTIPNTIFGPYWGSVIESVYDAASA